MKERKQWKKRVVSLLMALAMVITQIGVWNAGKESVQAAETEEVYKTDFSGYGDDLNAWKYSWNPSSADTTLQVVWNDNLKNSDPAMSVYTKDAKKLILTHEVNDVANSGNYYVSLKTNGEGLKSGNISIEIGEDNKQSEEIQFTNVGTYGEYKTKDALIVGKGENIKISISLDLSAGGWGYLDDITLTRVDNASDKDTDVQEYKTKALYFKYTGQGTPAILFWDKCGESLQVGDTTVESQKIESKLYYKMTSTGEKNWYRILFKYKESEVKNQDVGFDFGEIKDNTYTWIQSMDYVWNNNSKAYETIFSNAYDDPAIIQGDYDTVVSYKAALEDEKTTDPIVEDASITVTKVKNLSSDFIMGADISSMISELKSGVVYKDYDGNELKTLDDVVKFLADQGINHIRVRVWNNPYDANGNGYGGGNNDVAKAKEFADACRKAGIKMLVDFHCSDLWTDPGKQQAPKAWKNYSLEEKEKALKTFIQESLNTIDPSKDVVDMVQVGNETTSGFIGEKNTANMCALFSAGSEGVKAYNAATKVVIHVESPQKGSVTKWAKNLYDNQVDYDIIATSYYPYWHGTLSNLKSEFEAVRENYKKDVMVAETSYAYTLDDTDGHENTVRVGNNDSVADADQPFTEQGQATYLRNLINAVNEAGGLGVYYWEPAWITVGDTTGLTGEALQNKIAENKTKWEKDGSGWASSYAGEYDANDAGKWFGGSAVDNQALFYADGTATPAMHVWNYVKTGSTSNLVSVEKIATVSETITQKENPKNYSLPESVAVTYSDAKDAVNETVTWNEADKAKIDASKVGTYQVHGTVTLSKEITRGAYKGKTAVSVVLKLQVKKTNLIKNPDVVEVNKDAQNKFDRSDESIIKTIEDSENPYGGAGTCMGWWNGNDTEKSVTIIYNEGIELEKGSYTFELYAQGSAENDQKQEGNKITLQILDASGEVIAEGEPVSLQGWNVWQTPKVNFTLADKTEIKLQIKIETQNGGWGSVDELYLHEDENAKDDSGNSGSSTVTPSSPSTGGNTSSTPSAPSSDSASTDKKDDASTSDKNDNTDAGNKENTTENKTITATTPSGEKIEATVSVSKDKDGNVTEATATVTGTKAKISAEAAAEIAKAAGTDSVAITASVTDKNGKEKYTVTVDSKNLTANKKLQVVAIDPKTGAYKLVNAKTYKVGKDGTLDVNLATGADYKMMTPAEVKAVEKAILKTVEVKNPSASVKKGKKTQLQLSDELDMDNVKSITYKTGKKAVATVSKSGKITAKAKGTVTVKAIVTLKNGKKKTVSMKLSIR